MLLSTNNLIEADKENQTASAAKEAVQKYLNIQKRVVIQDYDETIFDFLTKYEEGKIVIIPKWLQRRMGTEQLEKYKRICLFFFYR